MYLNFIRFTQKSQNISGVAISPKVSHEPIIKEFKNLIILFLSRKKDKKRKKRKKLIIYVQQVDNYNILYKLINESLRITTQVKKVRQLTEQYYYQRTINLFYIKQHVFSPLLLIFANFCKTFETFSWKVGTL